MRRTSLAAAVACGFAITVLWATNHDAHGASPAYDDRDITLTGCVLKGEGGLLLTDVVEHAPGGVVATPEAAAAPVVPGPLVFYWLDDDDDLDEHIGRRVQVRGELEGDVDKGEIELERDGPLVRLEVRSGGRRVKASVPVENVAVGTAGVLAEDEDKVEMDVRIRKLDVESVALVAATCR
jgi:hypothetical protein